MHTPNISITFPQFSIVRDACEKEPLDSLLPNVPIEVADLRPTGGDYSVKGLEHYVAVERKSIPDLLQTLHGKTKLADGSSQANLGRFAWELQKLGCKHLAYVAIEGTRDDLRERIAKRAEVCRRYGHTQRIDYERTVGLISSLACEFGVTFIFFRDREEMAGVIYADLYHAFRRHYGLSSSKIGKYVPPREDLRVEYAAVGAMLLDCEVKSAELRERHAKIRAALESSEKAKSTVKSATRAPNTPE